MSTDEQPESIPAQEETNNNDGPPPAEAAENDEGKAAEDAPEKAEEADVKQEEAAASEEAPPPPPPAQTTEQIKEDPSPDPAKQPGASEPTEAATPNDGTEAAPAAEETAAADAVAPADGAAAATNTNTAPLVQAAAAAAAAQPFLMPQQAEGGQPAATAAQPGTFPLTDPMQPLPPGHMAIPMALDSTTQPPTVKLPMATMPAMPPAGPRPAELPVPNEEEVDLSGFPYQIFLGKDVISGKGGKVQQVNRHFRNMVAAEYHMYDSTASKISKRKIGLKIYQNIIDMGGRFLDHEGNPMDQPKAVLKVMKALKDAKTWTSDAKRNAKRRREESGGGGKALDTTPKKLPPKRPRRSSGGAVPTHMPPNMMVAAAAAVTKTEGKEEGEDGDGNGLNLLYQAMDGEKVDV